MYEVLAETLYGFAGGLMFGTVAFFAVMIWAIVYKYFTKEKFPTFLGIAFGLGFWGFTGGFLDIFNQPTFGGAVQILTVTIFVVWGINTGDKIAERVPKKGGDFLNGFIHGKDNTIVKLPNGRLIHDVAGKPKVSDLIKAELSDREFTLPADIPVGEIASRIKSRLITDWGIGDTEIELDNAGKITHLAISAREQGLSGTIPDGYVAVPVECRAIPSNLAASDSIRIFLDNEVVIDRIQVNGVDREQKVVTIVVDLNMFDRIKDAKASVVVALSSTRALIAPLMSVEHRSGLIEAFDAQKIVNSLVKVGVEADAAAKVAQKVQERLSKLDPPVSTRLIKADIIKQLEKIDPEAAKKLAARRHWRL